MLTFLEADISLSGCDAILYTEEGDWPERVRQHIPLNLRQFREALDQRKEDIVRERKVEGWGPGRLYPQQGPKKKIIHAHIGAPPDYGILRDCLQRIRDNYPKLGIKSIAMPQIGTGSGLDWKVVRNMLVLFFSEPNPGKGVYVEVYETDVPGKANR